jgi:hypothetical protein
MIDYSQSASNLHNKEKKTFLIMKINLACNLTDNFALQWPILASLFASFAQSASGRQKSG